MQLVFKIGFNEIFKSMLIKESFQVMVIHFCVKTTGVIEKVDDMSLRNTLDIIRKKLFR